MLVRLVVVVALVVAVALLSRWWSRSRRRMRVAEGTLAPRRLAAAGFDLGTDGAFAVLLGSAHCAPCEPARRVVAEVAAATPGLRWTYVDVADRVDLAEELRVRSVPTVVVLRPSGDVVARATGVPSRDELVAAVEAALEGVTPRRPA